MTRPWVIVREGTGPVTSATRQMVERLVSDAAPASPPLEWTTIASQTPAQARKEGPAIRRELEDMAAEKVLTFGPLALMAVRGDRLKPTITGERGRAQWIPEVVPQALLLPAQDPAGVWMNGELFRDFARDVIKWASAKEPYRFAAPREWAQPANYAQLDFLLDSFRGMPVSVDVETTGLKPLENRLLSVGLGTPSDQLVIPVELMQDEQVKDLMWDFLWVDRDPEHRVVMHNAKFDLQFLAVWFGAFPEDPRLLADTQLLHYLLDERPIRSRYRSHGLKDIARTRYDIPDYKFEFEPFWEKMDAGTLSDEEWREFYGYHAMDLKITAMLWPELTAEANEEWVELMRCHDDLLVPASLALAEAELRGMPVDHAYLETEHRRLTRRIERRLRGIRSVIGSETFNPGSPAQVREMIKSHFGVTEAQWPGKISGAKGVQRKGAYPVGEDEMQEFARRFAKADRHRDARLIASIQGYRYDHAQLSHYVVGIQKATGPDGRVHASYNIGGTVTGRLSSSEPNMQAIPKYGAMTAVRRTFRAPEGWLLLEADYSQLEIRVAALLSGDVALRQIYQEGRDMHAEVAALMFRDGAVESVSDEERFMAKAVNFGVLYGRSGWAISKGKEMTHAEEKLGMRRWSPEEAEEYIDTFLEGYPELKAWIAAGHERILRTDSRFTETPFGRRRRFFVTRTDRKTISALKRQAVNTPVQSVASDICLDAFCRLSANIDPNEARTLSIVHDAVLIEVREDRADAIAKQVKEIMENPPIETQGVPFKVDVKVGRTLHDDDMRKVS